MPEEGHKLLPASSRIAVPPLHVKKARAGGRKGKDPVMIDRAVVEFVIWFVLQYVATMARVRRKRKRETESRLFIRAELTLRDTNMA